MMFRNKIKIAGTLALIGIAGISGHLSARENVRTNTQRVQLKTTAVGCEAASAAIDLDINNVRARLMTGGDMWWNIGTEVAAYEVPKGSGKSSQFAASCWIGGFDKQNQLKVAAQTYRQDGNDYWPGALDEKGNITKEECNNWDKMWKVDRSTINKFIQLSKTGGDVSGSEFEVIREWPASNNPDVRGVTGKPNLNPNNTYAPFKDINGNGVYEWSKGEYPLINGDQYIWWVFNDAGNVKQQSKTASMGIEVQTSAFAYTTQDFLNNATFCNYRVINRGALTIDSTYIAVWDDCDLGYAYDDFIGCDTLRGLGIQYNGSNDDGGSAGHPVNSYGPNPPQVGLDFFQGPLKTVHRQGQNDTVQQLGMTNFTYYNNDASIIGNPDNGIQIYFYMTGSIRSGQRFAYDFQGPGTTSKGYGSGPVSNFVFWGDPGNRSEWSECSCNNNPNDRRFIFSSGPFQLIPGAINDITFGCVWAAGVGGCPQTNFKTIKSIDDQAQALFDSHFKTVEGPEAPRMVVRELDRKLIIYLVNDYGSNNYGENYGRADGVYRDSLAYHQVAVKSKNVSSDSLYHFEGYRVFQLANSQVTAGEIFDPNTGEIDHTKAYEVFQCDVRNGITQIVNYGKDISISDTTYRPQIKVQGKDSGIAHSFVLTQDQFSKSDDKRFINYHNYYFVAVAYSYNNFKRFDPNNAVATQDVAYLASSHGAGGSDIPVMAALPNPAGAGIGNVLNADFGTGVVVTRVEGSGNGGNYVQLDDASEAAVLTYDTVGKATYALGLAPIDVKIVDPVSVKSTDWVLQIMKGDSVKGVDSSSKWKLTAVQTGDVIYSERNITSFNEQIVEKYGISIGVLQVPAPGTNPNNGNGYISSDITFEDSSKSWLWGIQDQADSSFANWLRSGNSQKFKYALDPATNPCSFNDYTQLDPNNNYENMFANFTPSKSTWGPYVLAAAYKNKHAGTGTQCGFEVAYSNETQNLAHLKNLNDVNLVFTNDKTKWTRCAVVEEQEDPALAEGGQNKFSLRKHKGWNGTSNHNVPVYSASDSDMGMSWFPGYAIDQGTGERLNIVFGEDSYLSSDNGNDMIWNPTSSKFSQYDNSILFGGKHIVYILGTRYDKDSAFVAMLKKGSSSVNNIRDAYGVVQWVGIPTVNPYLPLRSLDSNLIPTKTTLRFRVNRPYQSYRATDSASVTGVPVIPGSNPGNPYYTFSTKDFAPTPMSDGGDRNKLLDKIMVVPNPYYGYSGYERNRFDTKVRITNLPAQATIYIYSLDGSLIRTLTKNDPNTSFIDWDIRNTAGLPIASGMYLMDVKAVGLGETVLRWFGATRPIDVTQY